MNWWHCNTGLAVVPILITQGTVNKFEKKCDLVKYCQWKTTQQTAAEFETMCQFVKDGRANAFAVLMGQGSDGDWYYTIDHDTKTLKGEDSEEYRLLCEYQKNTAIPIGAGFINSLPPATFIEDSGNSGVHYIAKSKTKVSDGKLDYHDQAALELIVNGLVVMSPSPGYVRRLGSDLIGCTSDIVKRLAEHLTANNILTKSQRLSIEKVAGKTNGLSIPISKIYPDFDKTMQYIGNEEYIGEAPWKEPSSGSKYFTINTAKNVAYCFHCNSGFDSLKLLARMNNIITDCTTPLRGELFDKTVNLAIERKLLTRADYKSWVKNNPLEKPTPISGLVTANEIIEVIKDANGEMCFVRYNRDSGRISIDDNSAIVIDDHEYILPHKDDFEWFHATSVDEYGSIDDLYALIYNYLYNNFEAPHPILYHVASAWVMATWRKEEWSIYAYLEFISAFMKGKSRAASHIAMVGFRMYTSTSITAASIYTYIEKYGVNIFLDEIDNLLCSEEASLIDAIMNSGNMPNGKATRTKEAPDGSRDLVHYKCGSFKIYAGTKAVKAPLQSRSISFPMRESSRKFKIKYDYETAQTLQNKLIMYRFRTLNSTTPVDDEEYEQLTQNVTNARLRDIYRPICQVLKDVSLPYNSPRFLSYNPNLESCSIWSKIMEYITKDAVVRNDRQVDPFHASILEAMVRCITIRKARNDYHGTLTTREIVDEYNICCGSKSDMTTGTKAGTLLKDVWQFTPSRDGGRGIVVDEELFARLKAENKIIEKSSELKDTHIDSTMKQKIGLDTYTEPSEKTDVSLDTSENIGNSYRVTTVTGVVCQYCEGANLANYKLESNDDQPILICPECLHTHFPTVDPKSLVIADA